jgi:hypothetical protein
MRRRGAVLVAVVLPLFTFASCGEHSSGSTTTVPSGWKLVSYRGVHLDVPMSWPVVDGMHAGFCDGPFPATPTAFVGPQEESGAPSCGGGGPIQGSDSPVREGVWLQPGSLPSDPRAVDTSSHQVLLEEAPNGDDHIESLWYHGILVEVGLGSNPALAKRILNSIAYTPREADTPVTGVCARSPHPNAMPIPERLAEPLLLEHGQMTLDPPLPSDRSSVSPAQVWRASDPKQPYERYRLLLTRYSAPLPARRTANGSLTPLNNNELSWVVYAFPYSSTVPGCGGWGVDVFDAHSGQELISSGWSPGP